MRSCVRIALSAPIPRGVIAVNEKIFEDSPIILKKFLGYMGTIRGKSPKTVYEYHMDLRTFFRYIKQKHGLNIINGKIIPFENISIADVDISLLKTVTLVDVFEYMDFLMNEKKNSAVTRSRKVSSLRSFFKYLTVKSGDLKYNPVEELETPKIKKSLPKFLSLDESKELLKVVSEKGGKFRERDWCILTLFLNCGIRLSELVGINLGDIKCDGTLKVTGKGNKERIVYLNEACVRAINDYMLVRPKESKDKNALFISRNSNRISPKTIQTLLKKYLTLSGMQNKGYSVHKLRHTAATLMYQYANTDIRVLKEILGHENLGTTEIYTHLSSEQMKQSMMDNPLAEIKKDDALSAPQTVV